MKGLIFYSELQWKVINPDKLRKRRAERGWRLVEGKKNRAIYIVKMGMKSYIKSTGNEETRGCVSCSKL